MIFTKPVKHIDLQQVTISNIVIGKACVWCSTKKILFLQADIYRKCALHNWFHILPLSKSGTFSKNIFYKFV